MDYIELNCIIEPNNEEVAEILTAQLAALGYESFVNTETGLFAYIPVESFDKSSLDHIFLPDKENLEVTFEHKLIKQRNWNAEWESGFKPVLIGDRCIVRAPFHDKDSSIDLDIVIEPKMSFGTAHHETTKLMIKVLLDEDISGKTVLDMGCGTGVLAIIAQKLGAAKVTAIDNDEWAFDNSQANVEKNNCHEINVLYGDAALLSDEKYDIILANINRNILLNDIASYNKVLNKPGLLILSGFYEKDLDVITKIAGEFNLSFNENMVLNDWVVAKFNK